MGKLRIIAALTVALLSLSTVASGAGFESLELGPRANGMGGAFRAVANDWTAAYYNPAGLAFIPNAQLGGNLSLIHYRNEITPNYRWGGIYESGIINDRAAYNDHAILSNPSAGAVFRVPFAGETVIGLSAYQTVDYDVTWNLYRPLVGYGEHSLPHNQYQNDLDVVSFQLTLAREFIPEKLSFGLGLQVLRGDLLYTNLVFRDNPYLARDPEWVWADRPWEKITQWTSNDGYGWGFGINLGLLHKTTERLTLAASANIPMGLTASGSSALVYYMPDAEKGIFYQGTVEALLTAGWKVIDSADFECELNPPASFGVGMAYQINDKLLLAADVDMTMWSSFEGYRFEYTNHRVMNHQGRPYREVDTTADMNAWVKKDLSSPVDWANTMKLSAGVTYDYNDLLSLMAGMSYDQSPARDNEDFHPLFMDLGSKLGLSAGLMLHINEWDLGLVTTYINQPDADVPVLEDVDGDGITDTFAGNYKAATYQTVLSFNYRF